MAFGNYGFNQQPTPYQAQSYPSINPYIQQRTEYAQINQPGTIPARYVTGREEAVAAQIVPGDPFIFCDFAHGRLYVKQINPQTMAADFVEFVRAQQPTATVQEQTAQFATLDDIAAVKAEIAAIKEAMQPSKTIRKAANSNDE